MAAANWTCTMVAWRMALLPSERRRRRSPSQAWCRRLAEAEGAEVAGLGAGAAIDKALAEDLVAAGPVLGDLEVQAAFIDVGRRAADGQRGADPLQPGWAGDLDAAAVNAQDPPAGGQALEPDHHRRGAGLGQQPATSPYLWRKPTSPARAPVDRNGPATMSVMPSSRARKARAVATALASSARSGVSGVVGVVGVGEVVGSPAAGLTAGCPAGEAAVAVGACRVVSATVVPISGGEHQRSGNK